MYLGIDFLITHDLKPYVIEINVGLPVEPRNIILPISSISESLRTSSLRLKKPP